jgi:hypothetical protein
MTLYEVLLFPIIVTYNDIIGFYNNPTYCEYSKQFICSMFIDEPFITISEYFDFENIIDSYYEKLYILKYIIDNDIQYNVRMEIKDNGNYVLFDFFVNLSLSQMEELNKIKFYNIMEG